MQWRNFSIPIHIYSTLLWYLLWSWSTSAQSRDRCVARHFSSTVLSLSIHCYRLSLSLDGLWEIKKGGGFGIRQHSFLSSDNESIKNLSLCPVSKFYIFTNSESPIIPHIISADSYKLEFGQFSPAKSSPISSLPCDLICFKFLRLPTRVLCSEMWRPMVW